MRDGAQGAQRASLTGDGSARASRGTPRVAVRPQPVHRTPSVRAVAALLVAAIVAAVGMALLATPGVRAGSGAAGMKAVVIVGPASSSTQEYLDEGDRIARQAEAQGMDVRRIFTPHATWTRAKAALQGANLVVYLGHGNGWPSPLGPFRGETKNGFGLNPCDGDCGSTGPTKYYGEDFIRDRIQLAPNAVVFLHRLCYASGNGESGTAPVFNRSLATDRASNFAAGFLDAGAAVVFALGWRQRFNLPQLLATTDRTMDEIFMSPATDGEWYDGFMGWDDYYRDSTRTRGARVHLDPHKRYGSLRAVTGALELTAAEWRGETPLPDEVAPTVRIKGTATSDALSATGVDEVLVFSPNGDGVGDRMVVRRSLSEPAYVRMNVRDESGSVVRSVERYGSRGSGVSPWDGRDEDGKVVPDGRYTIALTPRDRAGNVGETATVDAKVLTTLRRPRLTDTALHARDEDELSATIGISATLRRDAKVTIEIRKGDTVVRGRYAAEPLAEGTVTWRWNGRDDDGRYVPDGRYTAYVAARTDLGTLRYEVPVRVGNWRLKVDHHRVRRGQEVRLVAKSLEPLKDGAKLEISQPGLEPRVVEMHRKDKHTLAVTFRIARGGDAGKVRLRVLAHDVGGQQETDRISIRLR